MRFLSFSPARLAAGLVGAALVSSVQAATFIVTSQADSGTGSLRDAIAQAAALPGADRITFDSSLSGLAIVLATPLTVDGQELDIDASSLSGGVFFDGGQNGLTQPTLTVGASGKLRMNRVYFFGGRTGIVAQGQIDITSCAFQGNYESGVKVFATGVTCTFNRCTFIGNYTPSHGGGILVQGRVIGGAEANITCTNCTFYGNYSANAGGALSVVAGAASLTHCTAFQNFGGEGGGIMVFPPSADGFGGRVSLNNCIVADNSTIYGGLPDLAFPTQLGNSLTVTGANLIGVNTGVSAVLPAGPLVGTANAPLDPQLSYVNINGGFGPCAYPAPGSLALDAAVGSTQPGDQRGFPRPVGGRSDLGAIEVALNDPARARFRNVSTRLRTGPGDSVAIAGFAVRGGQKRVAVRALGPSLIAAGLTGVLSNPSLEIVRSSDNTTIATNDDWQTDSASAALLLTAQLTPGNTLESALVLDLEEGNYTAIVRGVGDNSGICLAEVYDLSPSTAITLRLINVSTRGQVGTGENVMIAGFVVASGGAKRVLIRALGPSLAAAGVTGVLQDPTVEVRDSQIVLGTNDDWQSSQAAAITASGFAPTDARESAIILTLRPGSYTAIVRGKVGTSGNAIVEAYELP